MAKQVINNGEDGEVIRGKINDNFTELYGPYKITNHGLVGDGVTDNSAALAALITAAPAGSTIVGSFGDFLLVTGVTISKQLNWIGEPGFRFTTASNITMMTWAAGSDGSYMEGVAFNGNDSGAAQRGLNTTAANYCYVINCTFTNLNFEAIRAGGNLVSPYRGSQYIGNRISSCPGTGINVFGQYNIFSNNSIDTCGVGIAVTAENNTITGGTINTCTTYGITGLFSSSGKLQVRGVTINHCSSGPFSFNGVTQPIDLNCNAIIGGGSIVNCAYVRLTGDMPTLTIEDQPAGSIVYVDHCFLPGNITLDDLNAAARVYFTFNRWNGASLVTDQSGIVLQAHNYNADGTLFSITNATTLF